MKCGVMIFKRIVKFCDFVDRVIIKCLFESIIISSVAVVITGVLLVLGIVTHRR